MRTSIWLLLSLGILCPSAGAQSTFGSILGTATDASGAVVAGANVTLRNIDDGVSATTVSGAQGYYQFLNLQPGCYQISAEGPGFATQTTPEIALQARETRRADFRLEVASRADAVTVTASIPVIDTENGTIADSKGSEEIIRLPLNYRAASGSSGANSPLALLLTVPGIQQDKLGRLSLGGGLPGQVEVSIDGISAVGVGSNTPLSSMTPSAETLGEFRVTSVDAGAEFSQMGDIAMVTRGGTNQLHGGVFWYHQNRALDATTYGSATKQQKVFNTFGGSLGGPVELPGLYQGRNRTFFFADYEGVRQPHTYLEQLAVPSASMRAGDLTGVPGGPAVDPLSGAPFPDNTIPATRISSVSRLLLANYYPLPNVQDPNAVYNFLGSGNVAFNQEGYDLRLDHVISSKQHVFGRWSSKQDTQQQAAYYFPAPGPVERDSYHSFVLSHTFTLSATLINEARFGFSRARNIQDFSVSAKDAVATLGLTGLNLSNVGNGGGFPYFDFSDSTNFSPIGDFRSADLQSTTFQYTDALSWTSGRHSAKFGADVRRLGYRTTLHLGNNDDFGYFTFMSGAFSGNAFADLLLGLPATADYGALGPNIEESSTAASFFAQDNWRVNRRLTLNYGLRWEVHPPFQETAGNITNFDHQTGSVIIPDHTIPAAPGFLEAINACTIATTQPCTPILTASQVGLGNGLRKTYHGDWSPRFGFAWQPWANGKTVIRGGIGRYTQTLLGALAYGPTGVHSSDVRTFDNYQGAGLPPLFTFPNASPPLSQLGTIGTETFDYGVDPTLKDPHSTQWNFTLERELPGSTSLRASYIGLQSVGQPVFVDFNQVPASNIRFSHSRQPFQQWNQLVSQENVGFSNYQGLQVELSHRLRKGITFQATYVLAKNLGEAGTQTTGNYPPEVASPTVSDRFDTGYDRGNLGGSRRNRFLLTGLFSLPFARNRILGGWELSTVTMIESGPYQTPTISSSLDQSNTDIQHRPAMARPDRIGNGNLSNPTPLMYYDKSAFVAPPAGAGRFGNAGAGILEGPGTVAIAAGLGKTFRLTEKLRLRTEATFTNLPNHPNFLQPNVNISSPAFGKLTTVQTGENSGNRTGQLSARLVF
jgi:hypothetical protein